VSSMSRTARNFSIRAHFGNDRHPTMSLATLYWAAMKGSPFVSGIEPTDGVGGYGRATTPNDSSLWGTIAADAIQVSLFSTIVWPAATGLWSITDPLDYWAIFDAPSGGTLWYAGPLSNPFVVAQSGDQPRIPAGGMTLTQAG